MMQKCKDCSMVIPCEMCSHTIDTVRNAYAAERWNRRGEGGMKGIINEQIHPCKGCEDYVPENGCKSNGGCGAQARLRDLIMEVFNMRPSTANKCIAILDDIKAIIERETSMEQEDEKCAKKTYSIEAHQNQLR